VVRLSELGSKGPEFDPRVVPKSESMFVNIYHYCVLCYIMCLIVVSVCTIVNLQHRVSLALLFGSMYITVLNCIYVMLCSYDDLCYIICTVLRGRYCVIQHLCYNTNTTIIIKQ